MSHSTLITDYLGTGTLATRPVSPNLPAGCIGVWLASDTGEASLWNGTAWQDIASVNTIASGNGIAQTGSIFGTGTISVKLGAGLSFSSGNIVAAVPSLTAGAGIVSITSGTIVSTWQGGTVTSLGSGVSIVGGALTVAGASLTAGAGIVSVTSGTIVANYQGATVTSLGSGLTNVAGALTPAYSGAALSTFGTGLTLTTGNLTSNYQAGTITAYGSGLSLTSGTLMATGSGGTVTNVATNNGVTGGPITGAGTIGLSTRGTISLMGNPGTAVAVPSDIAIGPGLTLSAVGTLSATGVTSLTAGAGIVSVTAGTIVANYQAGTVTALGTGLTNTSGTLSATASASGLTPNIQTASYTIAATDVGKLVIENATTATTLTVPSLATIGASNVLELSNINTGIVTVTVGATNGTIDTGGTTFFLGQGQAVRMTNNGTNWFTERMVGATTVGAGGGVAFGTGNTVSSSGQGFIAGIGNSTNNGAIALGQTLTATGSLSVAIGSSSSVLAAEAIMIGNASTLTGVQNLMIANSSSNSASNPFPAFGLNLLITGGGGGVVAGNSITATGTVSFPYGYQANDHGNALGHYRGQAGPAGSVTTPTQREEYTFWNSNHGTIAVNLSNNGAAPASITVGNPGTKTAGVVNCQLLIMDRANGNGVMYYTAIPGVFNKGTTAASMAVNATLTAGAVYGSGLTLVALPTLAADTTNGGFSIGYTPPLLNTDTLWATAWLDTLVTPGIA